MAELVNGDGTIPQATGGWAQKLISSSTNTSPITVTFCSAHCSNEGDTWGIEGHKTNTAANGNWRVHVTGTQTLQLLGSTGNGVGGLTGYGIDYSVNPLIQVGDDGEAASASNNNTPIEALANTVPYMFKRAGKYSLFGIYVGETSAGPTLTPYSTTTPAATTWTSLTGMTGLLSFGSVAPAILPSDWLEIEFQTSVNLGGTIGSGPWAVALAYELNGGAYTTLIQSIVAVTQTASPISLSIYWAGNGLALAAGGDLFNIAVQGWTQNNTTSIVLFNSYIIVAKHYRLNA